LHGVWKMRIGHIFVYQKALVNWVWKAPSSP
jgi:hypothetical protein